jgi:hypothetical protein
MRAHSVTSNRQRVALARLNFYQRGTRVVQVERVPKQKGKVRHAGFCGRGTFFVCDEIFFGKEPPGQPNCVRGGAIRPSDLEIHLPGMSRAATPFASPSNPNSVNTSLVCSPSPGACEGTRDGVPPKRAAGRAWRTLPSWG